MSKLQPETPVVNLNPQNDIPIESLELIRNRLHQVYQSLRKLADQINYTNRNPKARLPSYLNLHGQFQVLITQLHSIASQLDHNSEVLGSTNAYPLPNFPTTQYEGLVTTLLRKKPLPAVDEWVDEAIKSCETFKISVDKDNEIAEWCQLKVKELADEYNFDGFLTEDERSAMETDQDANTGDIDKGGRAAQFVTSKPPMDPNVVMKFMTHGVIE
ncbi:hypothetical protein METBIDRAFT_135267 [Metschnikowia bicuspidata var. bicuspidata NRRL YB-4993]|uniref:Mediator of RNA polymerase II transcription subunit 8 n=1 Tax=Metschnikowia bicuspidata var. bicuspidata NRRL YB-4993 TaxID=869754 RepID=A0A1A0HL68_9ASCO|nr:hypothetical protein METBIDRAFT_135267 [Metschnikowia bicuspidata var. bicuspidata NRRL YB-4993]OBA24558.1 hypothetical protein METBIDRAFT_135267 [Metschnikowia bicuspidata var. bicuspidata NRRL YB-4993]